MAPIPSPARKKAKFDPPLLLSPMETSSWLSVADQDESRRTWRRMRTTVCGKNPPRRAWVGQTLGTCTGSVGACRLTGDLIGERPALVGEPFGSLASALDKVLRVSAQLPALFCHVLGPLFGLPTDQLTGLFARLGRKKQRHGRSNAHASNENCNLGTVIITHGRPPFSRHQKKYHDVKSKARNNLYIVSLDGLYISGRLRLDIVMDKPCLVRFDHLAQLF